MVMIKEGWKKSLKKVLQDCHEEDRRLQYNGWVRLTFPNAFLYIKWLPPSNFNRTIVIWLWCSPSFTPSPPGWRCSPRRALSRSRAGRLATPARRLKTHTEQRRQGDCFFLLEPSFLHIFASSLKTNLSLTHSFAHPLGLVSRRQNKIQKYYVHK